MSRSRSKACRCRNRDCTRRYKWTESTADAQPKSWCSESCRQAVLARRREERGVRPSAPVRHTPLPMGPPEAAPAPVDEKPGESAAEPCDHIGHMTTWKDPFDMDIHVGCRACRWNSVIDPDSAK